MYPGGSPALMERANWGSSSSRHTLHAALRVCAGRAHPAPCTCPTQIMHMHLDYLPTYWKGSQCQKDQTHFLKHSNSDTSLWHLLIQASLVLSLHLQRVSSSFPLRRAPNPEAESISHCCFWPTQAVVDFPSSPFTQLSCSLSWRPHFTWAAVSCKKCFQPTAWSRQEFQRPPIFLLQAVVVQ